MIRIGICGYGNLGKGVEEAIKYSKDMELVAIFSRRDIQTAVPLIKIEDMEQYRKKIDVVIASNTKINKEYAEKYSTAEQKEPVKIDHENIKKLGVELIEDDLIIVEDNILRHNSLKLSSLIFSYLMRN